ncbi:transporter [Sphingomonas mollis]|uniref:Transporter n=1 Tax=Sphingomonas mollis TaxID=2795726 RepID=A0ABS0XSQ3_9SPHN|nr:transporter [Sphingomonas sp. BT553]MBJ6122790.1 transporter [Sphingomonas sp. BT553]
MRGTGFVAALLAGTGLAALPAEAQRRPARPTVQQQLDAAQAQLKAQQARIDAQDERLAELQRRLDQSQAVAAASTPTSAPPAPAVLAAQAGAPGTPGDPAGVLQPPLAPLERVGQAPVAEDRPIELAVLDSAGSIVTRKGQLTGEVQLDYARADRNRAVFRGIELVEAVLVGVFDINESRQDVITSSAALRYGLTDRLELGVRLPVVHRSDSSILAPISGSTTNDAAATIDNSVKGNGIGDLEVTARYQLLDGRGGTPYLIANLQGVIPTGSDPFAIPRDTLGRARRAATGAGFWGIAPSLTAILPSDPVVLFGTLGYTFNLGKHVNTEIPPVLISYVDPGDAISASAGIGISFNQRTTLNLGYAHSWALGTKTRTQLLQSNATWSEMRMTTSRDLQIGRLLFGVTYRVTDRSSINWSVELGATDDATDLRTVLRVPTVLLTGR